MAIKLSNRRESTTIRYAQVREAHKAVLRELGAYASLVPKGYIFQLLKERTGLSPRTLSRIINHS